MDRDGQLALQGDPRVLFTIMLGIRMWMICSAWKFTAVASLIAGRYAAVRR